MASDDKAAAPAQKPYIGGQALLEGVMMRSPSSLAMVVRRRDGSLHIRERAMPDYRRGIAKVPLLRGIASFGGSLRLGHEALRFSAEQFEKDMIAADEENEARSAAEKAGKPSDAKADVKSAVKKGATASLLARALGAWNAFNVSLSQLVMAADGDGIASGPRSGDGDAKSGDKKGGAGMAIALVFMVLFIWALPQLATALLKHAFHMQMDMQSPKFQAITGVFKLTIVVSYMLFIRRTEMVRRMFQYHGAEHKTISTYEAGLELTVPNARGKTTLHPRCGTTFLVMVALVSVVVFTGLGAVLPKIDTGHEVLDHVVFFLLKLPFIPVIAGLTFELQRLTARYCTTGPLRVLLWPGFLVQKITTIEPDDEQLEVALASLRATLFRENGESGTSRADVRFPSYDDLTRASRLRRAA